MQCHFISSGLASTTSQCLFLIYLVKKKNPEISVISLWPVVRYPAYDTGALWEDCVNNLQYVIVAASYVSSARVPASSSLRGVHLWNDFARALDERCDTPLRIPVLCLVTRYSIFSDCTLVGSLTILCLVTSWWVSQHKLSPKAMIDYLGSAYLTVIGLTLCLKIK